jgi:hypothetical protein
LFSSLEKKGILCSSLLLQQLGIISSRRQEKPPVHHAEARYIHSRKRVHWWEGAEMLPVVGRRAM